MDSGYVFKVQPTGFADGSDVGYESERGVKDESKVFDLSDLNELLFIEMRRKGFCACLMLCWSKAGGEDVLFWLSTVVSQTSPKLSSLKQ